VVRLDGGTGDLGLLNTPPPCASDASCYDGDPCTVDLCESIGCIRGLYVPDFVVCKLNRLGQRLGMVQEVVRSTPPRTLGGLSMAQRLKHHLARARELLRKAANERLPDRQRRKALKRACTQLDAFSDAVEHGQARGRVDLAVAARIWAVFPRLSLCLLGRDAINR
jgi:hypothetical protein